MPILFVSPRAQESKNSLLIYYAFIIYFLLTLYQCTLPLIVCPPGYLLPLPAFRYQTVVLSFFHCIPAVETPKNSPTIRDAVRIPICLNLLSFNLPRIRKKMQKNGYYWSGRSPIT